MMCKLPAELLGRPSPEETSAKGRNAAQPPHFADLGSSTFRRHLVLQAARRTAPAVALVPGNLFVPTDISAPAFGAATRPVACRPSIRLRRVPAGRRLLQRTERSTDLTKGLPVCVTGARGSPRLSRVDGELIASLAISQRWLASHISDPHFHMRTRGTYAYHAFPAARATRTPSPAYACGGCHQRVSS